MNPIVLQKVDPAAGHLKYYRLSLFQGADAWHILHQWGRIGSEPRETYTTCPDLGSAEKVYNKTLLDKRRGGYVETGLSDIPKHHLNDSCPSCGVLRANTQILGGRSAVRVHDGYMEVIFCNHVPLIALDVASMAKFMGEVRGLARKYTTPPDLVFPGGPHARAHLLGSPPSLENLLKEKPPTESQGRQLSWIELLR